MSLPCIARKVRVPFLCEKVAYKQEFLMKAVVETGTCLFTDVTDMGRCVAHEDACELPQPADNLDILVSGFSCKNFSGLHAGKQSFMRLLMDPVHQRLLFLLLSR